MKSVEDIYQELLRESEPLMSEVLAIITEYPQGVAAVGLARLMASHAKLHDYDPASWLALVVRAGMSDWTDEETIEAVDTIRARLRQGYTRLHSSTATFN